MREQVSAAETAAVETEIRRRTQALVDYILEQVPNGGRFRFGIRSQFGAPMLSVSDGVVTVEPVLSNTWRVNPDGDIEACTALLKNEKHIRKHLSRYIKRLARSVDL